MANDMEKRITAKMVLDSTGFNSSIQGVNAQLKLAQSELKASSEQLGVFGTNTDKLKANCEGLSKQIELQRQKVDIYKDSIDKSTEKLQGNVKVRDELKKSLDAANSKYTEAVNLYGKESEEANKAKDYVNKLTEEYKKKEKQIENNSKQINNYTVNMNKADAELSKMQGELQKTNAELDKSNNKWISASESLKTSSEKMKSVGQNVSSVGDGLLKVSAPFVVAGVASTKYASDFEDGMAKVSTVADTSKISLDDLGKGVLNLSNMSGESFTSIQDGLYDTISSGVSAEKSVGFLTTAVKAAKGGFTDTATSVDGLTTVLNAYGLKTEEVTNIANQMFIAQNLGKTTFGEMSSSMGNVIPTAAALKVSTGELFSSLATLTANGIKTSEAVTGLKAAYSNIAKPSDDAAKMAKKLGIEFNAARLQSVGWGKFIEEVKQKTGGNTEQLYQLFGSVEAVNTVLTMTSDQGMSLFKESMNQMSSNTTALDDAFNKVDNTAGNKLNKSFNELRNASIKLGNALAPVLEQVTNIIGTLADKLEGMDANTLKTITNVGLFTVGLGGVLKVGGGAISTVGNIAGVVGKLSGVLGTATVATEGVGTASTIAAGVGGVGGLSGLGTALGGVVVAAAPWLIAGAAVAGTGYAIYKGMNEQAVPAVNLFADKVKTTTNSVTTANGNVVTSYDTTVTKISEGTQKAVGSYLQLDNEASKSLTNLYVNSTTITENTVSTMTGKYNEMANTIKIRMDEHYTDQYSKLDTFFKNSSALTDTEEQEALTKLQQNNSDKKAEVDKHTKEIQDILQKASDEKRALTLEEQQKINEIQNDMKVNAVQTLSDSEVESKVILERLKDYSSRITTEQASDVISNAEKQRRDSVDQANQQYDETVKSIVKMRDETGAITSEQADKLIEDATRQKDDSISKAEEMKNGIVEKVRSMNSDVLDDINTTDGSIKTNWDKLKDWFANNPITRWIKSVTSGDSSSREVGHNWTGTSNWRGGMTTLNEKGYELYDLPQGTRIYNHEASEDLIRKTAESLSQNNASNVNLSFEGMFKGANFNVRSDSDIKNIAQELYNMQKQAARGKGISYGY